MAGVAIAIVYFGFAIIVLVLRYGVLPNIDHYRGDLEHLAGAALKLRVQIDSVDANWDGLRPRLHLSHVVVYDHDGRAALTLPQVDATLAWETLVVFEPRLHLLRVHAPELQLRRDAQGGITVGGILIDNSSDSNEGGFAKWLLAQHEISIEHADLTWTDEERQAPPLALADVSFELVRQSTRHRFALSATPPPALAAPFTVRGYFDRRLFGAPTDPNNWSGEVFADFGFVDLSGWHAYVDYPIEIARGSGAVRAWLRFTETTRSARGPTRQPEFVADVQLRNVVARAAPDLPQLALTSVDGRIAMSERVHVDEFELDHFRLVGADGLDLSTASLKARRVVNDAGAPEDSEMKTDSIDLGTLAALAERLPLAADLRNLLAEYNPRGVLTDVALKWNGPIQAPHAYSLRSDFRGLALAAQTIPGAAVGRPGFTNLDGSVSATQAGGSMHVVAHGGSVSIPGLLVQPDIALDRLDMNANWTRQGDNLQLRVSSMTFENADAAGAANLTYRYGPASGSRGPGYLDLSARMSRADMRHLVRYLPATLPEDLQTYLQRAIVAGSSDDASFRVKGALERFPFRIVPGTATREARTNLPQALQSALSAGEEEFHIAAHLRNLTLDYAPPPPDAPAALASAGSAAAPAPATPPTRWPVLENLDGEFQLDRVRMELSARSANIYSYKLEKIHAELPDIDDPRQTMTVHGEGSGPLEDLVRFVNASPLAEQVDHFTEHSQASGASRLDLGLSWPVTHISEMKVTASVQLQDNEVKLAPWLPPMAHANGRIAFGENGVQLRDLQAEFIGGPVRLESSNSPDHFLAIRAEGTTNGAALRRVAELKPLGRIARYADGATRYTVVMNLPPHGADEKTVAARGPRLAIDSNLVGLSLDFPEPLGKAAPDALPLHIEFDAPLGAKAEASDLVRARLGPASAVFARHTDASGEMQIQRAAYGVNESAVLTDARSNANINVARLDADAWQKVGESLAEDASGPAGAAPLIGLPDVILLRAQSFTASDKKLSNLVMSATRSGSNWQANLTSDEAAGAVSWHQGALAGAQQNRITARLSHLAIPKNETHSVDELLEPGPSSIPGLDVVAENFEVGKRKLGRLELVASNAASAGHREWRLEKLVIANAEGSFEARGTWGPEASLAGSAEFTRINFSIDAKNVGNLLDRLGYPGNVKDGTAQLKGDVSWHGSPLAVDYASLSGQVNLAADKGQFLKAEPGAAKLLGVLSLQSLTRRFTLDFNDLFGSGFAFDSIRADARLDNGVATTSNFEMKGVSAFVYIDGSVNLARETQDVHVRVLPQLNLGVGAIGYALLANPIIGLSTFALGEALRDPLSRALAFEYNVTGPWAAPEVVRQERGAAKAPAAPAAPGESAPAPPKPPVSAG